MQTTTGLMQRLKRTRFIVRLVMIVERLWPLCLPLVIVAALFAVISWFGLFRLMPDGVRYATGAALALAALVSLYPLTRLRLPRSQDIDHRIERAEGGPGGERHILKTVRGKALRIRDGAPQPGRDSGTRGSHSGSGKRGHARHQRSGPQNHRQQDESSRRFLQGDMTQSAAPVVRGK